VVFSIFEGFNSDNPIFIAFRAVSLSLFIIVPLIFIITNKPGLQRLLVISEAGELLYGFNFGTNGDLFSNAIEKELNDAIMTAGFLAALTSFSTQFGSGTNVFTIRSQGLYFTLLRSSQKLFALQAFHQSKALEKSFRIFCTTFNPPTVQSNDLTPEILSPINDQTRGIFKVFF
jgi:hypothetical protein